MTEFTGRMAVAADIPALTARMDAAISQLQGGFLDPARVRAMYTNPVYARRSVGRLILSLCEAAAGAEGFTRLELMSTLSGEPLYTAYGFRPLERLV